MRARHALLGLLSLALIFGCEGLDDGGDGGITSSPGAGKLADSISGFFGGGASNDEQGGPTSGGEATGSGSTSGGSTSGGSTSGGVPQSECQVTCVAIVNCLVSLCQLPATQADISAAAADCATDCAAEATAEELAQINQMTANQCAGLAPYEADICGDFDEDDWENEDGDDAPPDDDWDSDEVDGPNCDTNIACPAAHCVVDCGADEACGMRCVSQFCGQTIDEMDEESACACSTATIVSACNIDPSAFEGDEYDDEYDDEPYTPDGGDGDMATCEVAAFCEAFNCVQRCGQDQGCLMSCQEACQPLSICDCPPATVRQCGG